MVHDRRGRTSRWFCLIGNEDAQDWELESGRWSGLNRVALLKCSCRSMVQLILTCSVKSSTCADFVEVFLTPCISVVYDGLMFHSHKHPDDAVCHEVRPVRDMLSPESTVWFAGASPARKRPCEGSGRVQAT